MIFKLAFRNIIRQKRRSILTIATIVGGFAFGSMAIGMRMGSFNMIIDMFTRAYLGHIQLHADGYLDQPTLYKVIEDYEGIGGELASLDFVEAWAPRLYAAGLVSVDDKSDAASIIGVDPELEESATTFSAKIETGNNFSDDQSNEVILGKGLMEALGAGIGDELVLVVQAADGSMGNDLYRIIGSIDVGNEGTNRMAVYMRLDDAQELMVMPDRAHEIVVIIDNIKKLGKYSGAIKSKLAGKGIEVSTWDEINVNLAEMIESKEQAQAVMQFVIMLIVAVGVLNTVLMSVLERTREFGILKALGTRPISIFRLIITESTMMSLLGIIGGAIVGSAVNFALSRGGIVYPEPYEIGGILVDTMKSEVNLRTIFEPAIAVFFTALIVSIFPALRAAKTEPAKSMRFH
ncbi:ABC transporter permease [bacterium]|nr:ABC transporter permease [bacterium]